MCLWWVNIVIAIFINLPSFEVGLTHMRQGNLWSWRTEERCELPHFQQAFCIFCTCLKVVLIYFSLLLTLSYLRGRAPSTVFKNIKRLRLRFHHVLLPASAGKLFWDCSKLKNQKTKTQLFLIVASLPCENCPETAQKSRCVGVSVLDWEKLHLLFFCMALLWGTSACPQSSSYLTSCYLFSLFQSVGPRLQEWLGQACFTSLLSCLAFPNMTKLWQATVQFSSELDPPEKAPANTMGSLQLVACSDLLLAIPLLQGKDWFIWPEEGCCHMIWRPSPPRIDTLSPSGSDIEAPHCSHLSGHHALNFCVLQSVQPVPWYSSSPPTPLLPSNFDSGCGYEPKDTSQGCQSCSPLGWQWC